MIPAVDKYHAAKGPKKWVLWVSVSVVVFLTLIALYLSIRRRQKEIAALRTQAEMASLKAEQNRFEMSRAKDDQQLQELVNQTNELQHSADLKRREISKNEKDLAAELKQVEALKSWKDLDAYNRRGR